MQNGHLLSDVDSKESSKIPCILHMDSIKGSHSGLKNIIQRFVSIYGTQDNLMIFSCKLHYACKGCELIHNALIMANYLYINDYYSVSGYLGNRKENSVKIFYTHGINVVHVYIIVQEIFMLLLKLFVKSRVLVS